MKKSWNNPDLKVLNVAATKEGPKPATDHDMTTYDNSGKWWGGGQAS